MKLFYADNNREIATVSNATYLVDEAVVIAKSERRVVQIGKHCQFCGKEEKPLSEMSLDEMFSYCCWEAEESDEIRHELRNQCGLCGEYSYKSRTHSECMNKEQALADHNCEAQLNY